MRSKIPCDSNNEETFNEAFLHAPIGICWVCKETKPVLELEHPFYGVLGYPEYFGEEGPYCQSCYEEDYRSVLY